MAPLSLILLLASAPITLALHVHPPTLGKRLPSTWYQPEDHPVHKLFRRGTTDGATYPVVGSPEWLAAYPPGAADTTKLPQAWVDALNTAVAAGLIPNISQTTQTGTGNPAYPNNANASAPDICSSTDQCRAPGDIWDAPDGVLGIGFDDGPLPPAAQLYAFLQSQNQKATHYMIGTNILANPDLFTMAFDTLGHDIACHTWTHPYLTTQSNLQLLGELGYTMQLIHDSTGGRVVKYYRPPYGDADNRVRAVAKQVFGMEAIIWNQDTEDWSIGEAGGTTAAAVATNLQTWITGPKSPGLIILEHELTNDTVQAFINAYPSMKTNGWNLISQCDMANAGGAWVNANGTDGPVLSKGILANELMATPTPTPTPTSASGILGAANGTSSAKPSSSNKSSSAPRAIIHDARAWIISSLLVFGALISFA